MMYCMMYCTMYRNTQLHFVHSDYCFRFAKCYAITVVLLRQVLTCLHVFVVDDVFVVSKDVRGSCHNCAGLCMVAATHARPYGWRINRQRGEATCVARFAHVAG